MSTQEKKTLSPEMVETIISAFARIMEKDAPPLGTVADEKRLPYPKAVIKQALRQAMETASIACVPLPFLSIYYMELSNWQPSVDSSPKWNDLGADGEIESDDPATLCSLMVCDKYRGNVAEFVKWAGVVAAERQRLAKELCGSDIMTTINL